MIRLVSRFFRCAILSLLLAASVGHAQLAIMQADDVDVDQILAKAREKLGPEEALKGVQTLRFYGSITNREGVRYAVFRLDFARPNKQRMVQRTSTRIVTTYINGSEGFVYSAPTNPPGSYNLRVLSSQETSFYLDNARENLNFYLGPRQVPGGKVSLLGQTIRRGRPVYRVAFEYPSGGRYDRYFDRESFELVATTIDRGEVELVQMGYKEYNGLNFPEVVESYSKDGHLTQIFNFEEVVVNPEFPEDHFELPEDEIFGYNQEETEVDVEEDDEE